MISQFVQLHRRLHIPSPSGTTVYEVKKCSDDSHVAYVTYADITAVTIDDYFWYLVSGTYTECYLDGPVAQTADVVACAVGDPSGTPTQCSDVDISYFSDDFDSARNECKWVVGAGTPVRSGGVERLAAVNALENMSTPYWIGAGDFDIYVNFFLHTFSRGSNSWVDASLSISTSANDHAVAMYDNGTKVYRCFHEGSYYNYTPSALNSGTFRMTRVGSTWTYYIDSTQIYQATGDTGAFKISLRVAVRPGYSGTIDVSFDDLVCS